MKKREDESVGKDAVHKALIKKALGYDCTETVEEYVNEEDGTVKLAKKKITKKNVPPDITALKILLDDVKPIEEMTDEELEKEKERLLNVLAEKEKKWKEK